MLAVRVQECFGWAATPRIVEGRVAVLLHLLSPARRPVAVTDDCVLTHMTGYPQPKIEWLGDIATGAMCYHAHEVVSVQADTIAGFPVVRGRTRTTATLWGGRGTWNLQLVGYVVPDADPDTERNPTGFRFSRLDASTW